MTEHFCYGLEFYWTVLLTTDLKITVMALMNMKKGMHFWSWEAERVWLTWPTSQ